MAGMVISFPDPQQQQQQNWHELNIFLFLTYKGSVLSCSAMNVFTMCLCCFAATTSFIVVSMHSVIRGFGFNRRDAGEAMIPIAGKGQGRHQPQLTVVCASWLNNRPALGRE